MNYITEQVEDAVIYYTNYITAQVDSYNKL